MSAALQTNPPLKNTAAECRITQIQPQEKGIEVQWSDQHKSFFHYIWLRDSCYCPECGDSYSSKRLFMPTNIPKALTAKTATIDQTGMLSICWHPDGHQSLYSPSWLRQYCYDDAARKARRPISIHWTAKIENTLPIVDFAEVIHNEQEKMRVYRHLRDYGLVIIQNAPRAKGFVSQLADWFGDMTASAYDAIFDLSPASSVRTMGNTFKAVPPHTDEAFRYTPPGINILGCVQPAQQGGETVLVDGFAIAEQLRQEDPTGFALLSSYSQPFHRLHEHCIDQRAHARMINLDDEGKITGIRLHTRAAAPLDLPSDIVEPYYAAYRRLCELMMHPDNQLERVLAAGEAAVFDNQRVLHARSSFSDPERFLQLCNVPRESFHERLRLLATKLGYHAEAQQVLSGGTVC